MTKNNGRRKKNKRKWKNIRERKKNTFVECTLGVVGGEEGRGKQWEKNVERGRWRGREGGGRGKNGEIKNLGGERR